MTTAERDAEIFRLAQGKGWWSDADGIRQFGPPPKRWVAMTMHCSISTVHRAIRRHGRRQSERQEV